MNRRLPLVLACLALSACGLKGDLYLPPPKQPAPAAATPAQSPAQAAPAAPAPQQEADKPGAGDDDRMRIPAAPRPETAE